MKAARPRSVALSLCLLAFPSALLMAGQQAEQSSASGAIEFIARVAPSAGKPEPARQLTFYLLRKSYTDIQKEVEKADPPPELVPFIDSLDVSAELKAWMKKHNSVELAGPEFPRWVTTDDIFSVPEFYQAYMKRNAGDTSYGFPKAKYKESDKQQNPQKYERQKQEYEVAVRKFIEENPQSKDGIEIHLDAINPSQRWTQKVAESKARIRRRTWVLSQTQYLTAKTDTDLDGRGWFGNVAPGTYWLGTLETEAIAGDSHLRWDLPIVVRTGQTTRVELSNLNALEPPPRSSRP